MKTKLIGLTYRGSASVDPRFSVAMLPWTINNIRITETFTKLSIGVENGLFEAYNAEFELQFFHYLKHVVGMCRIIQESNQNSFIKLKAARNGVKTDCNRNFMELPGPINGMVYLLKDPRDPLLHIHLYECDSLEEMTELMQRIRGPAHILGGSVGNIPQTILSSSNIPNEQSLQNVFRGNVIHSTPGSNLMHSESVLTTRHDPNSMSSKISSSKSYTHGLSNSAGTVNIPVSNSATSNLSLAGDISPNHTHFFEVMYVGKIRVSHKRVPFSFIDDALPKFKAHDSQRAKLFQLDALRRSSPTEHFSSENLSTTSKDDQDNDTSDESAKSETNELKILEEHDIVFHSDEGFELHNPEDSEELVKEPRTKLLKKLVRGQSQIILPIKKDIPRQRDRSASYGCIPLVDQNRTMVFLVGKTDLRLISPDRKQILLHKDFKDVASCAQGHKNADHFGIICREGSNQGYIGYIFKCQSDHVADDIVAAISQAFITCSEQKSKEINQIFSCEHCPMLWYHKLCSDIEGLNEKKSQSIIFKRIESLTEEEQEIIWAKYYGAEKMNNHNLEEQNQFLMMLLRIHCESRQQRHVHDTAENRSEFLNQYLGGSTIFMKAKRSLTSSFDHILKRKGSKDDYGHSAKDILHKEGTSEGGNSSGEGVCDQGKLRSMIHGTGSVGKPNIDQLKSPMMDIFIKVGNSPKESTICQGSWRQAILNSVVTPSKNMGNNQESEFLSPMRIIQSKTGKRTKEELKELWKTAIRQTILLNRMEKENARLQARQSENELKKIKLDYDEIIPCDKQGTDRWEMIIEKNCVKIDNKKDPKVLLQAIKIGVPRSKRGDVWSFLANQHSMNTAPVDTKQFPHFNASYHVLLKSLTEHQHAIFIDLGRTFPNHKFYRAPLGIGQLSLFNLLKAYSILDPELGYCQGLGFICGILLLHCEEDEAFQLLKHLMFRRQMRTKYLPNMKKFQLQLYQLSRLVKDFIPDLYEWLDQNDVSTTLYAAPWILTVFSSQFPLGFVARVFDLLFLESSEVIFKVAVALLAVHKDELLARNNFEDIMDYLKTVVPSIDEDIMNNVLKQAFSLDISKELAEYQVEYNVLQEEITAANHHLDLLNREKHKNQHLENQLQFAQSSIAQLEKTRSVQQLQITSLQSQVQTLEVTIQTLGRYVAQIIERHQDIDLPSDIRRILQQLDDLEMQRKKPLFVERKIGKSLSASSQLSFPLKVLEELSERESEKSPGKKKTAFFEHTYEQLRQQKAHSQRPSRLMDNPNEVAAKPTVAIFTESSGKEENNLKSPSDLDSGIGTPLSPYELSSSKVVANVIPQYTEAITRAEEMHPLSMCGDVNFRFNGTTQLKSIRPLHPRLDKTNGSSKRNSDQVQPAKPERS